MNINWNYLGEVQEAIILASKVGDKHEIGLLMPIAESVGAEILIIKGKGDKTREAYISKETAEELKKFIQDFNITPTENIFCFKTKNGTIYKDQDHSLWTEISRLGERVLNRHVHPHMLRHSKATIMSNKGASLEQIQSILGHSSVQTTAIYVHVGKYKRMVTAGKYM